MKLSIVRSVPVALLALAATGCGAMMTRTEIDQYGTHVYDAPAAKVFPAVVQALKSEGYEVPIQNPDKGTLRTDRKVIRTVAVVSGSSAAMVDYKRQYDFVIHETDGGKTQVVAIPHLFSGDTDISDQAIWALDGPQGERAIWTQMFKDIGDSL